MRLASLFCLAVPRIVPILIEGPPDVEVLGLGSGQHIIEALLWIDAFVGDHFVHQLIAVVR
jgi:hypothetical protein